MSIQSMINQTLFLGSAATHFMNEAATKNLVNAYAGLQTSRLATEVALAGPQGYVESAANVPEEQKKKLIESGATEEEMEQMSEESKAKAVKELKKAGIELPGDIPKESEEFIRAYESLEQQEASRVGLIGKNKLAESYNLRSLNEQDRASSIQKQWNEFDDAKKKAQKRLDQEKKYSYTESFVGPHGQEIDYKTAKDLAVLTRRNKK